MFTFAWPYAFLLLPLFWVIERYWPKTEKKHDDLLRIPFLPRVQAIEQGVKNDFFSKQRLHQYLSLFIWIFLVLACANPQWLGEPMAIPQAGRNIMLAVDLSQSMEIPDLQKQQRVMNRLDTIKEVAAGFIEKRQGDKLGLILFGSKAYLQTPLTFDRQTVKNMLDDATIGLAGARTAIGDAIGLAVKKFDHENIKSRILILLTDGANNSGSIEPLEAAQLAKDHQIKIYTVGIGAQEMIISSFFGPQAVNPSADLDEDTLKKIADLTQGQYFRAQDEQTLANILEAINRLEPVASDLNTIRPISALFYWPLTAALLLLFILIFPKIQMRMRSE